MKNGLAFGDWSYEDYENRREYFVEYVEYDEGDDCYWYSSPTEQEMDELNEKVRELEEKSPDVENAAMEGIETPRPDAPQPDIAHNEPFSPGSDPEGPPEPETRQPVTYGPEPYRSESPCVKFMEARGYEPVKSVPYRSEKGYMYR